MVKGSRKAKERLKKSQQAAKGHQEPKEEEEGQEEQVGGEALVTARAGPGEEEEVFVSPVAGSEHEETSPRTEEWKTPREEEAEVAIKPLEMVTEEAAAQGKLSSSSWPDAPSASSDTVAIETEKLVPPSLNTTGGSQDQEGERQSLLHKAGGEARELTPTKGRTRGPSPRGAAGGYRTKELNLLSGGAGGKRPVGGGAYGAAVPQSALLPPPPPLHPARNGYCQDLLGVEGLRQLPRDGQVVKSRPYSGLGLGHIAGPTC